MDNDEVLEQEYWYSIIADLDRKDNNSERRYRRYNKSLDAMGEKTVAKEDSKGWCKLEGLSNFKNGSKAFLEDIENEILYRALFGLNSNERLTIIFLYEKGLTFNDIALVMNTNYDTVQKRHYRAIEKLKKNLIKNV